MFCPFHFLLTSCLSPHSIYPDRIQFPVSFLTSSPSSSARMGRVNRIDYNPHLVFGSQSLTSGNRVKRERTTGFRLSNLQLEESNASDTLRKPEIQRERGAGPVAEHLPTSRIQAISQTHGVLKEQFSEF